MTCSAPGRLLEMRKGRGMDRRTPLSPVAKIATSQGNPGSEGTQMSQSKVLDPHGFRRRFAEYWSVFLQKQYDSPEHVAVAFGVRFQTALNWWQGANRPTGDVVALAFLRHPEMFKHMRDAR